MWPSATDGAATLQQHKTFQRETWNVAVQLSDLSQIDRPPKQTAGKRSKCKGKGENTGKGGYIKSEHCFVGGHNSNNCKGRVMIVSVCVRITGFRIPTAAVESESRRGKQIYVEKLEWVCVQLRKTQLFLFRGDLHWPRRERCDR